MSLFKSCKRKNPFYLVLFLSAIGLVLFYQLLLGSTSFHKKYTNPVEVIKGRNVKYQRGVEAQLNAVEAKEQAHLHDGRPEVQRDGPKLVKSAPPVNDLWHQKNGSQFEAIEVKKQVEIEGYGANPMSENKSDKTQKQLLQRPPAQGVNPPITPKHYTRDHAAFAKYKSYFNQAEDVLPTQTRAVIILTNHRSGSSFFGELFNQHPDAFYFFEPLFPLSFSGDCTINNELKTDTITKLVQCKFPNWGEIYQALPSSLRWTKGMNLQQCIKKGMCFRCSTKEMVEERHCPRSMFTRDKMDCLQDCGTLNAILGANDCRRKKLVAMKLIRMCDILQLEKVVHDTDVDVKVLHLIRDPRGILNSRRAVMPRIDLKESIRLTCARQARNVHTALFNTPDWLKGRYKLFRYEDVATSPYATAKTIFDFVGLSFPDSIKSWIAKNTGAIDPFVPENDEQALPSLTSPSLSEIHAPEHRERREIKLKRMRRQDKPSKNKPYGTSRNSTATVLKWTRTLSHVMVKTVEGVCQEIMNMTGYRPVGSPEEYSKKDAVKYFTDIPAALNT